MEQWQKNNISDYTMMVESFEGSQQIATFNLKVQNGHIVENGNNLPKPESQYTVDSLFNTAYECTGFCSVDYDAMYGYPRKIVWGFNERSSIEVVDFQPELKANR